MLETITAFLDWFGVCVFAMTGALVASRKQMDIVGFALMGSVAGIGGGTIRDVLLGVTPVFWVQKPAYLITCLVVSSATFGGIIRDILGGESPVILSREIYITAALLDAGAYTGLVELGTTQDVAVVTGFASVFVLRSAALTWQLSLPRYSPRMDRDVN